MKIVCLGDSLTKGYKVKTLETWPALLSQRCNAEVLNKGVNGDTTGGMLSRFDADVIKHKPTHVIIMGGVNDLILDVPLTVLQANVAAMAHQAIHHLVTPLIGIPFQIEVELAKKHWPFVDNLEKVDEKISAYRQWVLRFAVNFGVHVLDFYKCFEDRNTKETRERYFLDGLHPTVEGHETMCQLVLTEFEAFQIL